MNNYFITGTDTNVGKTLVSAIITQILQACYWKPIQSGIADDIPDRLVVKNLIGLSAEHFPDSIYELKAALSPNQAAELENVEIEISQCKIPTTNKPIIIEGAGGVYVPINQRESMLDLIKYFNYPVIVVARGTLGTINHTLLTVETLRKHQIPIHGIVFNGELNPENQKNIEQWSHLRTLFHVPLFTKIDKNTLNHWMVTQQKNILRELT